MTVSKVLRQIKIIKIIEINSKLFSNYTKIKNTEKVRLIHESAVGFKTLR